MTAYLVFRASSSLHRKASYSFLVGNYDMWSEEKKERKILTHETISGMIHLTICFPQSSVSNNKLELDMRKKKHETANEV